MEVRTDGELVDVVVSGVNAPTVDIAAIDRDAVGNSELNTDTGKELIANTGGSIKVGTVTGGAVQQHFGECHTATSGDFAVCIGVGSAEHAVKGNFSTEDEHVPLCVHAELATDEPVGIDSVIEATDADTSIEAGPVVNGIDNRSDRGHGHRHNRISSLSGRSEGNGSSCSKQRSFEHGHYSTSQHGG